MYLRIIFGLIVTLGTVYALKVENYRYQKLTNKTSDY